MLSGQFSLFIPGVSKALNKLDEQKAKFLAIPANVRAALDRLGRIRFLAAKNGPVTVEFAEVSQVVEQNLKATQLQWETAAERFSQLDSMRRTATFQISGDTLLLTSQLLTSVGYVVKNANANIAAVDRLGDRYLTAEQKRQLSIQTTGSTGVGISIPLVAAFAIGFLVLRRR